MKSIFVITAVLASLVSTSAFAFHSKGERVSGTVDTSVIVTAPVAGPVTIEPRSSDHQR